MLCTLTNGNLFSINKHPFRSDQLMKYLIPTAVARSLLLILLLVSVNASSAARSPHRSWREVPEWRKSFKEANVEGCFLLYDLQANEYLSYNKGRVNQGFLPASTYKILNSMIALETGAVRDENEVLKWDGVERMVPAWNNDQDMRDAFKNSAVWFYQEMARRVGPQRMQHYVNKVNYGNRNIGGGLDQFWLKGALRITSKQQIDFLVKLYRNQLPFPPRTMDVVKDIMIVEKTNEYVIRAKTGWVGLGDPALPQIGWCVGYLERANRAYFFAMNIDLLKDEDAAARMQIVKRILSERQVIER
jgi:beta-lactamase class D